MTAGVVSGSLTNAVQKSIFITPFDGSLKDIYGYNRNLSYLPNHGQPSFSLPKVGNNSLYFHDTQNDKIGINISIPGIRNMSADFWMRFNGSTANKFFFYFVQPNAYPQIFFCNVNTQLVTCYFTTTCILPSYNIVGDTNWHHYVVSMDTSADRLIMWVDGNIFGNVTCNQEPNNLWTEMALGDYITTGGGTANNFEGNIDNFMFTEYVYKGVDVTASYNGGAGYNFSSIVILPVTETENLNVSLMFKNSSGFKKTTFYENEYFSVIANVTSSNNNSMTMDNIDCSYSVDGSDREYPMKYNTTTKTYISQLTEVFSDEISFYVDLYCTEHLDEGNMAFYDYMENETTGFNSSKWNDNNLNYIGKAESIVVKKGLYSANLSGDSIQKSFPSNASGIYTTEFYLYKHLGEYSEFHALDGTIAWRWNESNHVIPLGWGGISNIFYMSPGEWHKIVFNQTDNYTIALYVDNIFKYYATDAPNQLWIDLVFGLDSVNQYSILVDNVRVARHNQWSLYSNFTDDYIDILNIPPVINNITLTTGNITQEITDYSVFEYYSGNYVFNTDITDDDIDTITISLANGTDLIDSITGTELIVPYQSFIEDEAGLFTIIVSVNDTDGDSAYIEKYFIVTDSLFPVCYGYTNISVNQSHNYYYNISCYDEAIYSFNITCDDSYSFYETNISDTSYYFYGQNNITQNTTCLLRYCDGHTNKKLSNKISAKKNGLQIDITKGNNKNTLLTGGDSNTNIDYTRLEDRYKITIDYDKKGNDKKKKLKNSVTRTLRYTASPHSTYIESDTYDCWIIDAEAETWFDCNLDTYDDSFSSEVTPRGNGIYDIAITSKLSYLSFESIGELNCINETQYIEMIPYIPLIPENETNQTGGGIYIISFGEGYGTKASQFNLMEILVLVLIVFILMFMMVVGLWKKIPGVVMLTAIIFLFLGLFIQWLEFPRWISIIGVGVIFWSAMMIAVSIGLSRR
jgi:hypothetical protein